MTRFRFIVITVILFLIQIIMDTSLSVSTYFFLAPVCFVIMGMERGTSSVKCMVAAFFIGLGVDLLSSGITGLWSASLTASVIPRLMIVKRRAWDDDSGLYDMPSCGEMGLGRFLIYALFVNAVFYGSYVLMEKAGFALSMTDLVRAVLSTVINSILMVLLSLFTQVRKKN